MNKNWRWLPAGIVPVVIVTAAVSGSAVAEAQSQLPAKTAQELLEFVATSSDDAYSGTVEQSSDLGLPDMAGIATPPGGTSSSDPTSTALELLTGEHTAQVYVDGTDKARVQVLDQLAQRDVVVNGSDAWYYDSQSNEATHATLPDREAAKAELEAKLQEKIAEYPELQDVPRTPAELAEVFLAAIDPSTEVTVDGTSRVAGRSAYQLVLTPEDAATLIGSIAVSVDSETGVPLNVTVEARGQEEAAFAAGFSSVDFSTPDAGIFEFTPPAGATVTEVPSADEVKARVDARNDVDAKDQPVAPEQQPTVIGEGWSTIVELPAGSAAHLGLGAGPAETGMGEIMDIKPGMDPEQVAGAEALLEQALTEVDGGRALQTSLVSVLITDDGRILAGAVGVDQLVAASQR
ncbi:outer membrane lipoprotein carrier protein LolA [Arthrobacter sp. NPDC092385]|uniref:LolA family protein n=1 Tax=Arthrobacter sp. NPDC092385 TaxID=3363943 RepID=UPI0038077AFF